MKHETNDEQDLPWEEPTLPDPDDIKPEGTTEAELDAFDLAARQQLEVLIQQAREEQSRACLTPDDPRPGTAEALEAIRDAIKQGK